jgi:hypothetical protein
MFKSAPQARPLIFTAEWFRGTTRDLYERFFLILAMGAFASFAGGAGFWLFLVNLPFVRALLRLPVIPLPNVLIAKLKPMSDFYVVGTLAWFVAVAVSAMIFFQNLKGAAALFLLVSSIIGTSAFVWPQVIFHVMIVRAQSQMADAAVDAFRHLPSKATNESLAGVREANEAVKANALWVFDRADVTTLLLPDFVALLGLILKSGWINIVR